MPSRVRILIADDHTLVAELCQKLLEPEFEVVGLVNDGQALVPTLFDMPSGSTRSQTNVQVTVFPVSS